MAAPLGLKGTWYRLPQGTPYDDAVLFPWNDYGDHWSWEPAQDMPLTTYIDALRGLVAYFRRLP